MTVNFTAACLTLIASAAFANAGTFSFAFSGGGITSSGTITATIAPDDISGVVTPDTYEITNISGTFNDTNDGVSGTIEGLYTPISYVDGLTSTASSPVAFTTGGLSYDDLFFPLGNSSADCPGYPFSGGDFDVYGVAFNLSDGDVGEFFSNGILPGTAGPLYGAADASATSLLDNPNAGGDSGPVGVLGSLVVITPEPSTFFLLGIGLAVAGAMRRFVRRPDPGSSH